MSDHEDENKNEAREQRITQIYKVSIKYSTFNRDDPEIWFRQLETQFELNSVTADKTKYGHLVAALDIETIKCVRELVLKPPTTEKYSTLKLAIIERLCESTRSRLSRLFSGLQLGDRKPTQLLREMQALSANQISEPVLRSLWLQRLPTNVQEIISSMEEYGLDKTSTTADKIMEIQKPNSIYSVHNSAQSTTSDSTQTLLTRIDALTKRFDSWCNDERNPRKPLRTRSNESRQKQNKTRSEAEIKSFENCWYHFKFGNNAKKCNKPCKYETNQTVNASENR